MAMIELSFRGRAAVAVLSRPPVNAINDELIKAFNAVLDELAANKDWSVLHIRSSQKVFAAGADLDLIRSWKDAPSPGDALAGYIERLQALYHRLENLHQVTVCEINGAAMGGGLELALSCDLRVAADEAKIGLPEVGIGLLPGAGGTQRLTRLCGYGTAARIILGCEPVDVKTAVSLGIAQWSAPREQLEERARAIVDKIANLPPHALQAAKRCMAANEGTNLHGFMMERDLGGALLNSVETQRLINDFLERNTKR